MIYRLPELSDKEILMDYVSEHRTNGENSISASVGMLAGEFSDWVNKIHKNASIGNEEWGRSLMYLCLNEDKLIGLLSIRYDLSELLRNRLGDIGYGVRPSERNKGYATEMLRYALSVCKQKGMDRVILGCYKDNLASSATIKKNKGTPVFEADNYNEGRISQYYTVDLQML